MIAYNNKITMLIVSFSGNYTYFVDFYKTEWHFTESELSDMQWVCPD